MAENTIYNKKKMNKILVSLNLLFSIAYILGPVYTRFPFSLGNKRAKRKDNFSGINHFLFLIIKTKFIF